MENIRSFALTTIIGGAALATVAAGLAPGIATYLNVERLEEEMKGIRDDVKGFREEMKEVRDDVRVIKERLEKKNP